jgi:DNA polymerase-3 subunit chi
LTHIEFIFNVVDKTTLAIGLTEQLIRRNRSVLIFFEDQLTIDHFSLSLSEKELFMPHLIEENAFFNKLSLTLSKVDLMDDTLINFASKEIKGFSRYLKMYELVGHDDGDKNSARERYRFYKDCGYQVDSMNASNLVFN